jgi:metal-sulfur cluster biosynthetic enzyme
MQLTKELIQTTLEDVLDPELNISIVDLGLVYEITISKEKKVSIRMTLTTIGCPLFSLIETEIRNKLQTLGVKDNDITIDLAFDPPWSMEKMSERAKAMLGI